MGRSAEVGLPNFAPASLLASNVGTWERDPELGLIRFDQTVADMFGFTESEVRSGVHPERVRLAVDPDDHHILDAKIRRTESRGGLVVFEYRTRPTENQVRWLLVRGRYEPIQLGQKIAAGRGIVIDITETKLADCADDEAFFLSGPIDEVKRPLDRAADLALALHQEALLRRGQAPGLVDAAKLALHVLQRAEYG